MYYIKQFFSVEFVSVLSNFYLFIALFTDYFIYGMSVPLVIDHMAIRIQNTMFHFEILPPPYLVVSGLHLVVWVCYTRWNMDNKLEMVSMQNRLERFSFSSWDT